MNVTFSTFSGNQAIGGDGGAGDNAPADAQGGGLFNLGTATLTKTTITGNKATGGAAGSGGLAGLGIGGVYNAGSISIDTLDLIFGNEADEWDDCFGCD